jgi:hypothetical protein
MILPTEKEADMDVLHKEISPISRQSAGSNSGSDPEQVLG